MPREIKGSRVCSYSLLCCLLTVTTVHSVAVNLVCPGLQQGVCTAACQTATCSALARFFNSSFVAARQGLETASWADQTGWELTRTQSCQQILRPAGSTPSYCSWYGITCCTAKAVAQQQCSSVNTVLKLHVPVNGVNGSVEDPTFVQSILQLHTCGLTQLSLPGNDLSGSIGSDWARLSNLTVLDLGNNWISGTIPSALRTLEKLIVLDLGNNLLSGPVPDWIGGLTSLQVLNLGANVGPDGGIGLSGGVPPSLGSLKNLWLLDLNTNALTGTIPADLCQNSRLSILSLRSNSFIGVPHQLLNCTELTQLDISSNKFSGTLPDSPSGWNWSRLVALDASYNDFEGSIPDALYGLSVLGYLNLGYNRFSGSIQRAITLMQYLTELQLNNNQLSGVIDENLWYLPQLSLLDLSNNKLTGSISTTVGLAFSLEEVVLGSNQLTGSLPAELGIPKGLRLVDIRKNAAMHCNSNSSADGLCRPQELLPCFLTFSEATVPRIDGSNMGCPAIIRRPYDEAVQLCSGKGPTQLGEQAANLADARESEFEMDPSYFHYHGCQCLGGYRPLWSSNKTMTCVAAHFMPTWVVPVVIVGAVAAVMLLAASALLVWLRMTVQLRPRWQREKELNENRKKGMPSGGPATIVVTDVEGYSDLMQVNAPLTTKAMGIHNAILRKAVAAHAGHVVEQEGDSWSVAFHTPMDAVAFCLQVQQALQRTNWPVDLGARQRSSTKQSRSNAASTTVAPDAGSQGDSSHHTSTSSAVNSLTGPLGSAGLVAQGQALTNSWPQQLQACRSGSAASNDLATTSGPQALSPAAPAQPTIGLNLTSRSSRETRSGNLAQLSQTVIEDQEQEEQEAEGVDTASAARAAAGGSLDSLLVIREQRDSGVPAIEPSAVSADGLLTTLTTRRSGWLLGAKNKLTGGQQQHEKQTQLSVELPPRQSSPSNLAAVTPINSGLNRHPTNGSQGAGSLTGAHVGTPGPGRQQNSSRFWSMLGLPAKDKSSQYGGQGDGVIRGLRVRMGVATGWVPRSTNIARCALFELAKAVSDMANGGQVLLEANTFHVVRNRLTELGTVDHRGYNDKLRASASKAVIKQQTSCLFSCLGRVQELLGMTTDVSTLDTDALLLDMGEYFHPTLALVIPAAAGDEPAPSGNGPLTTAAPAAAAESKDAELVAVAAQGVATPNPAARAEARCGNADAVGVSIAAAAVVGSSAAPDTSESSLQLFSILPRSLHARAKLWLSSLTFKEGTQQMVKSYFEAPGTGVADLSSSNGVSSFSDFDRPPLPAVTMVFATVEGGKSLVRKKPEVGRIVHNALSRIMQVLLMAMPERDGRQDGYLCRQQEAVLKYMLAFREPARAVEWALLLQEVLLHVPWPEEVLQELGSPPTLVPAAAATADGSPRAAGAAAAGWRLSMKIGLAEGPPDSISPDHLGRPDYFGTFVNLAARMMDAAAQGGQVVASVELAERIYSTWRFEAELGLHDLVEPQQQPEHQQQQQERTDGGQLLLFSPFAAAASTSSGTVEEQQQQEQQSDGGTASFSKSSGSESHLSRVNVLETEHSATLDTPRNAIVAARACSPVGAGPAMVTAAAGSTAGSQRSDAHGSKVSASRARLLKELLNKSAMLLDGPSYPQRLVHISGLHIGAFAFKGCGALDMISFTTDFMPVPYYSPTSYKGGKGALLFPGTGPVIGLQDCPIVLPDVWPTLQQACSAAAAAAVAAQQQQQERLGLRQLSQGSSSRTPQYMRGGGSNGAFAVNGEVPDGIRRFGAGNKQLGSKTSALAGNGSWSSGSGSATAAAAAAGRLLARLRSSKGPDVRGGAVSPAVKECDIEADVEQRPRATLRRLSLGSFALRRPINW